MNHFSLFVNLLGWGTRLLGPVVPNAVDSSCSLDMDKFGDKILDFTSFYTVLPDQVVVSCPV